MRSKIVNTTNEMLEIADGLGSGVSPEKIRTSISYGEDWLQEIKDRGDKNTGNIKLLCSFAFLESLILHTYSILG